MDELDRKLILELEKDGRKSSAQIALVLNTTKATIARRIQSLISSGFIAIRAKPDLLRIGWRNSALILVKANFSSIDSICTEIAEVIYVSHLGTHFSDYNIYYFVDCPSYLELHAVIEKTKALTGVIAVKPYFIEKFNKRPVRQDDLFYSNRMAEVESIELETGDMELIQQLILNGRQTYIQLSEALNRPKSALRRRVLWLIEQGVIRIGAIANPSWLGFNAQALILLRIQANKRINILHILLHSPDVVLVATITNEADICFLIQSSDINIMRESLIRILAELKGVDVLKILIRSELKKQYFARYLAEELHQLA